MSKFNLKQFITENKIGPYAKLDEAGPGFTHDCAAHVVHETYGHGICLEGQHTLVENAEGNHVVTHYDVFFKEGSKTVEDIPVEELKIITESSHNHPKNKKKNERLDPVGKEDGDIDNDGDKDETDKYLANRRKAIAKAIADKEKTDTEKDARKAKGMVKEATDLETVEILADMLVKLSDGNTTARQAAFEIAREEGVSFNLVLQKYQDKGGKLQDIDFETLKEDKSEMDKRYDRTRKYATIPGLGTTTDADLERERLAQLAARNEGDLDVGHQDDEPGMLKNKLFRAAKMAAMLYKKVDKYDKMGGEVDFPSWWQNKINKSQDMLQSAYDYLDGEENVAKLDAMAEKKVEVDDETEFKLNLRHLLDKHAQ